MKLGHASADMVCEAVAREGKVRITVASVYNILSQLALRGIYRHRLSSNSKMYFGNGQPVSGNAGGITARRHSPIALFSSASQGSHRKRTY